MNNVIKKIVFLLMVMIMNGCNNEMKFEKEKWNRSSDPNFPSSFRPSMLEDLVKNHKLIGLTTSQLNSNVGPPDYKDSTTVSYKIQVKYSGDIDPTYTKLLLFSYSKDSIIRSFKVIEWK